MSETPKPAPRTPSLIGSSVLFAALTLVSRIMGFARDLVVTAVIGASKTFAGDVYYTALAFPNLFRRIFAEGAFAAAFVPAYSKKLAGEGEEAADRLASDALTTVAFAAILLTVICQLAMPWIMWVYSHGFLKDPEKFKLAVVLTQITMPYLPCMVIASLFSGVLNARGRFIVSGAYPTLLNLVMLAAILPQKTAISGAWAASIAILVAGVLQAALVWWAAGRAGAKIGFVRPQLTPEIRRLLKTAVPAVVANSATQINITVSMMLAANIEGMRSWMSVADRLYQLPMSLVGVAIGIALLPRLSASFHRGDETDAKAAMDQGVVLSLALTLPAAAALLALPHFLIDGLFTRGEFTAFDAQKTGTLLLHYGWGVPAFVLLRILQPPFFARGDTRTPMITSLVSVAVNIALGYALFNTVGYWGLAAATSAAAWINVVQLTFAMIRRGYYHPDAWVISRGLRVLGANIVYFAVLALANWRRPDLEGLLGSKEVAILAVVAVAAGLYPLIVFAFGGVTPAEVKNALKRRPKVKPQEGG